MKGGRRERSLEPRSIPQMEYLHRQCQIKGRQEMRTEMWDDIYCRYQGDDSVWREGPSEFVRQKASFFRHVGVEKVLDAPSGDGRNLTYLADEGFEVTGIDISGEAIEKCRERIRRLCPHMMERVTLVQGDLESLDSIARGPFDLILCDFLMIHLHEPGTVLEQFHSSLRPNGFLLLEVPTLDDPHFGHGQSVGQNRFIDGGIDFHFYSLEEALSYLSRFRVCVVDELEFSDPGHGSGYIREQRHSHRSWVCLAQKAVKT